MVTKRQLRADKHRAEHPADRELSNNELFKKYSGSKSKQ